MQLSRPRENETVGDGVFFSGTSVTKSQRQSNIHDILKIVGSKTLADMIKLKFKAKYNAGKSNSAGGDLSRVIVFCISRRINRNAKQLAMTAGIRKA